MPPSAPIIRARQAAARLRVLAARPFVAGLAATIANRGLIVALGTVSSVLVARGLGPAARGEYAYIMTVLMMVSQFSLLGLHGANVVFAAREPKNGGSLLGNSLLTAAVLGSLSCVGLAVWDDVYGNGVLQPFFPFLCGLILLQAAVYLTQQLALGLGNLGAYNLVELLPACLGCLLTALAFFLNRISVSFLLALGLLAMALALYLAIRGVRDKLAGKKISFSRPLFRECFAYGWRVYLACLFFAFLNRMEILLAEGRVPNAELGQYAVAFGMFTMVQIPAQVLGNLLLPKLAGTVKSARGAQIRRVLVFALPGCLVLTGALYLFGPWLIALFYGRNYADSGIIFQILLIGYLPVCLSSIFSSWIGTEHLPLTLLSGYMAALICKYVYLMHITDISIQKLAIANGVFQILSLGISLFVIFKRVRKHHADTSRS
jgi:O-antigen/teichoic acid export membrane protein